MKLIFLNRYCFPDTSATSQLLTDLAQHLAASGREVHVITSRQRYDEPAASLPAEEAWQGVRIHRVWTTRFGRGSIVGRSMDYASFFAAAGWRLLRLARAGDLLVAKTDPPLVSVVAAWVARRRGARLVNWLQDVFPEAAEHLGVIARGGLAARIARRLRDYSLRGASVNVAVGERMASSLQALGAPAVRVIHNWSDGEAVRPWPRDGSRLRADWGLSDRFVVGYSGNMGRAHGFETVLEAIERLRDVDSIVFLFVGAGQRAAWIRAEARRRGLEARMVFRDYQPRERLGESLSVPDAHLVTLQARLEGFIVPSKFYGIAAAARPTLFVGDPEGEIARIVRETECGMIVSEGDGAALAEAILDLHGAPNLCARLGANARRSFEERFDRPRALAQWEAVFREALEGPARPAGRSRGETAGSIDETAGAPYHSRRNSG